MLDRTNAAMVDRHLASSLPAEYTSPTGRVVVRWEPQSWGTPHRIEVHTPSGSPDPRERFCGGLLADAQPTIDGWLCSRFIDLDGRQLVDRSGRVPVLVAWEEIRYLPPAEAWEWAVAIADEVRAEVGAGAR